MVPASPLPLDVRDDRFDRRLNLFRKATILSEDGVRTHGSNRRQQKKTEKKKQTADDCKSKRQRVLDERRSINSGSLPQERRRGEETGKMQVNGKGWTRVFRQADGATESWVDELMVTQAMWKGGRGMRQIKACC